VAYPFSLKITTDCGDKENTSIKNIPCVPYTPISHKNLQESESYSMQMDLALMLSMASLLLLVISKAV
jgi:hypothetical protein